HRIAERRLGVAELGHVIELDGRRVGRGDVADHERVGLLRLGIHRVREVVHLVGEERAADRARRELGQLALLVAGALLALLAVGAGVRRAVAAAVVEAGRDAAVLTDLGARFAQGRRITVTVAITIAVAVAVAVTGRRIGGGLGLLIAVTVTDLGAAERDRGGLVVVVTRDEQHDQSEESGVQERGGGEPLANAHDQARWCSRTRGRTRDQVSVRRLIMVAKIRGTSIGPLSCAGPRSATAMSRRFTRPRAPETAWSRTPRPRSGGF